MAPLQEALVRQRSEVKMSRAHPQDLVHANAITRKPPTAPDAPPQGRGCGGAGRPKQ